MSDEYDEIRQACDEKIAAAMRRVAELKEERSALMEHKPWVGLTAEEVGWLTANFIKSIETKLKEKNSA